MARKKNGVEEELAAMKSIYDILVELDDEARIRILVWVKDYFELDV